MDSKRRNPPRAAAPRPASAAAPRKRTTGRLPPPGPSPRCPADSAIQKPASDHRSYSHVVLTNNLDCILVSDPRSEKVAVSINVPTGYFCDPNGLEGLSQAVQSSLLCGNSAFVGFLHFLSENKGSIRAITFGERTSYCVDGSIASFQELLTRFARFFKDPSFCEISRETALESGTYSEVKLTVVDKLQRQLSWKGHPYQKFRSEDLDILESVAESTFSCIKNLELNSNPFSWNLPAHETVQILAKARSVDGSNVLRIQWSIYRRFQEQQESHAVKYLLHVFNYKSEGSLFYILKEDLKWISSGRAHENDCHSDFSFLSFDFELTNVGSGHHEEICALLFRYITVLKGAKARKYIFEELERDSKAQFECVHMVPAIEFVDKIASNMLTLPTPYCLSGSTPLSYSEPAIRSLLNTLSKERVRIFLVSGEHQGETSSLEPVYPSSSVDISKEIIEGWMKRAPIKKFYLPQQNSEKNTASVHAKSSTSSSQGTVIMKEEEPQTEGVSSEKNPCSVCIINDDTILGHVPRFIRKSRSVFSLL